MLKYDELRDKEIRDRFNNLKWKIKRGFKKTCIWIYENKELVAFAAPALFGGFKWLFKTLGTKRNLVKQEEIKNLYCYDRSLGHYWKLRRELTNDEWTYIDKRKSQGERLADILNELKVLK